MAPPNHRGRQATGGTALPEHRLKGPLGGADSSGGVVMPQPKDRRGKGTGSSSGGTRVMAAVAGVGSSGGSREKAAAAAGTGSSGAIPLANLSNLIGAAGFRGKEPITTPTTSTPAATTQPRVAKERKYTRPWSSSSPRGPSLHTDQQLRSTKSYRRRFSLLSINDADSLTSPSADAGGSASHFRNTASGIPRESATRLGPVERPLEKPATAFTGGRMPPSPRLMVKAETARKHPAVTSLNVQTQRKHQAVTGANAETQRKHEAVTGANAETPRKHQAVTGANAETTQDHEAVTGSNDEAMTAQKHRVKDTVGVVSREDLMAQKSCRKDRTGPSAQVRHPSGTRRADTITELPTAGDKQSKGPSFPRKSTLHADKKLTRTSSDDAYLTADEKRRLTEEMMEKVQEADHVIQQLNELGVGEDINHEELQRYYEQLPCEPPRVDTSFELDDEQRKKLQVHHALCRIKYYKVTQHDRKDDMDDAELEDDYRLRHLKEKLKCFVEDESNLEGNHILENLDKEGLLMYIEQDDTFDWSFHYTTVAPLDDYQRLVPRNYGGCEYVHWDDYRKYFHKYEIELEYLDFWEELSKKLKWMEDYIHFGWPTLKWRRICSRGESQAIKIATGFSNITVSLAHAAYYEYIGSINMEICWYRELDGVYFEIWKRVTKLKKSFREALDEVYKLDKFPLRQHVMKHALESNGLEMERQFHNCTEGITEEVTEEKAQDLIADAMTELRTRPKFYAQYIKRKIKIARAIGIIFPLSL